MDKYIAENEKEMELISEEYDFTSCIERSGKDAIAIDAVGKWSGFAPDAPKEGFDLIPMWVADMNFPTAKSITKAISDRISHPLFGYFDPSEEYFDAIINWHKERNAVEGLKKEHIGYENGVLGGLISALTSLLEPRASILLHSPTYIGFTNCINDNGFKIIHSPLVKDEEGIWRMDFNDMDRKIKENNIKAAVFCNPHNPCGRVWEKWELEAAMEVYKNNDCIVISDEIWSDIIMEGYKHIPLQSVSDDARNRTIALYAPSKTFNLAGLIGSYHIIYNDELREKVRNRSAKCHYNNMNVLSMHALIGAYKSEGAKWLDELCKVINKNIDFACGFIKEKFSGVEFGRPEGTYMLFLDCTKWCYEHGKNIQDLEKSCWDVGVACQDGEMFNGPNCLRFNLALPYERVKEAFERLDKYVFN